MSIQISLLKECICSMPNACIILADFVEYYAMVVQDAVQGWHWTRLQCTIHLLVLYYTDLTGQLLTTSFGFTSDDLNYDIGFVYYVQKLFCNYLKFNLPYITTTHYFFGGCACQYKNYKNFLNLTFHNYDIGVKATWNFLPQVMANHHAMEWVKQLKESCPRKV